MTDAADPSRKVAYHPTTFAALPGWDEDDHAAAFAAFQSTCGVMLERAEGLGGSGGHPESTAGMPAIWRAARDRGSRRVRRAEARQFFEHFFVPHRLHHASPHGLLTGYYEPVIEGSRTCTERFAWPLYRRPPDLENVVAETDRGRPDVVLTHMRRTPAGLEPYPTRAEIEAGALAGQGLELIWLADPVDAFFAHVQGSVRIRLPDGALVGLTYDGKNGHPYTSIGRVVIERGGIDAAAMTLERLGAWLRADTARGREVMQRNASFVFFREANGASALGALGTPLVPGRSLAVDPAHTALGLPVFVMSRTLRHWGRRSPFQRLMLAHDVGSAIRGPERGDIYFGSGEAAGRRAGQTRHAGRFFVLLPKTQAGGDPAP